MEFLQKWLKTIIIFPKRSILDLWLVSEYVYLWLTSTVTPRYVLYDTYSEPCVTLAYSKTLSYSKSWHIYNPRCIQNSFKTYFDIFKTLCNTRILRPLLYSERCPIQNFGIFRTRGIFKILFIYPHSGIFRHIQ